MRAVQGSPCCVCPLLLHQKQCRWYDNGPLQDAASTRIGSHYRVYFGCAKPVELRSICLAWKYALATAEPIA